MAFVYLYPQIDRTQNFVWNITAEFEYLTGIKCWTSDVAADSTIKTAFHTDTELTARQKQFLDDLVARGGIYPAVQETQTVFEIDDLWELFTTIITRMGLDPSKARLRFGDIVDGKTTKIRLIYDGVLTEQQKQIVITVYSNMIREVTS